MPRPYSTEDKPFAFILHQATLAAIGERTYARGVKYATEGRVHGIASYNNRLQGYVQGSRRRSYVVSFWVRKDRLAYACDCPAAREGDMCKHCIALALVWLAKVHEMRQFRGDATAVENVSASAEDERDAALIGEVLARAEARPAFRDALQQALGVPSSVE